MNEELEIWKDIPGYEGYYQASTLGRIKSLPRHVPKRNGGTVFIKGGIRKQVIDNKGYFTIMLNKETEITYKVHSLIAMAFLNHRPCGYKTVVDHINNIHTDNRAVNLQITTQRINGSKDRINKSGKTGAYLVPSGKWDAKVVFDGKRYHLGTFSTKEEAGEAYKSAVASYEAGVLPAKFSNKTGLLGVHMKNDRYAAVIRHKYKLLHLGVFATLEEAAVEFDKAAISLRGINTKTNFPKENYL